MSTTSSLKDSLERWTDVVKTESTFAPRQIRAAAIEVGKQLRDVEMKEPEPYDLVALYRRVRESWHRDHSLEGVSLRDLRRLPWILFYSSMNDSLSRHQDPNGWLGCQPGIVREYGSWLSGGQRTGSVRALLNEFLRVYPVDLPTFEPLLGLLRKTVEDDRSSLPSMQKWKQRCLDFGYLERNGSVSFVEKIVSASDAVDDVLFRAGFDAGLARAGFLISGIRAYLPRAESLLNQKRLDAERLSRLLTLLECEGKLRFDNLPMRSEVAVALLRPFVDSPPDPATRERIQPFFLRHFRDPRLGSGRHKWSGIPDEIRRVVIRWLVERALEQFFLLVKETAFDRHWRYREAFWRAFHREGLIDDIWFVLGPHAKDSLWKMNMKKDETETTADLRGAQGDQSVLLLRMPGVTIAEWSHNGSCRIWLDGNSNAPELYQENVYFGDDLRNGSDFSQPHFRSEVGRWQDKIAQWLRENTGVEIARSEYFPDRLRKRETNRNLHAATSPRSSRSQAVATSPGDRQPKTIRRQTAAEAFRELQKVRNAVMASRKFQVNLRDFMDVTSPAWTAYVGEHGVPGYGTNGKTVLDRLDSTITNLRFIIARSKSRP